ncbi:glycosyltransferase [Mycobacterium sp. C3-094]
MKVLITVSCLSGGGAEFVAAQWALHLAQCGDSVTVYLTHPIPDDIAPPGVKLVEAPHKGAIAQARDLAAYLRIEDFDAVVALMPYSNLISIAAARSLGSGRPRVIISCHTLVAHGLRKAFGGGSFAAKQWLARRTYKYADLFVAVSHAVSAEAIAEYGLSPEKVTVVPNPAFAKLRDRVSRPSAALHDDGQPINIVLPGRLVPQKRPLVALDVAVVLSHVAERAVRVHYFGVGPLHEAILKRANEVGIDVQMHGWVANWFDDCPEGAVVLMTSVVEGFGNVLVEAAAAGFRSVVSSRCRGAADAIIPGITGELIAGDSTEEYANAVLRTLGQSVGDVRMWLERFSSESSGGILRDQMIRVAAS